MRRLRWTKQRWGLETSSGARKLAGSAGNRCRTSGKTAPKKVPHISACMRGRGGNLTTYSIRLRGLERRMPVTRQGESCGFEPLCPHLEGLRPPFYR